MSYETTVQSPNDIAAPAMPTIAPDHPGILAGRSQQGDGTSGKLEWNIEDRIFDLKNLLVTAYKRLDNANRELYERGARGEKRQAYEVIAQAAEVSIRKLEPEWFDRTGQHFGLLGKPAVAGRDRQAGVPPSDIALYNYGPDVRSVAHGIKNGDAAAIETAAREMAERVPRGSVLVPIPSRNARATVTKRLAESIAELSGSSVADVLTAEARESTYERKTAGRAPLRPDEIGMQLSGPKPTGRVFLVDNVIGSGATMLAARRAIGGQAAALVYARVNRASEGRLMGAPKPGNLRERDVRDEVNRIPVFEAPQIKSAIGNRGTFEPRDLLAERTRPMFDSALTSAVEESKIVSAPAAQWLAVLSSSPGVKQEEIEWSGVEGWLSSLGHPVTREQLADYLRANEIQDELIADLVSA